MKRIQWAGIAFAVASVLAGCASTAEVLGVNVRGKVQVTVDWPEQGRAIPSYANSLAVYLKPRFDRELNQVANRPSRSPSQSAIYFTDLNRKDPEDDNRFQEFRVDVYAYAGNNATGELVAQNTYYVQFDTFKYTREINVSLTLDTEVRNLAADALQSSIYAGQRMVMRGYALDEQGRTLVLPPSALYWTQISGEEFASLSKDGTLTAYKPGMVRLELNEVDNAVPPLQFDVQVLAP